MRSRGTTLVELLLALALVAIFSTSLISALAGGSFTIERARQRAVALGLARNSVEGRRAVARSGSLSTGTVVTPITRSNGVGPFTVTRVISLIGGVSALYRVNSKVTWTNNQGSAEVVELELWIRDQDE